MLRGRLFELDDHDFGLLRRACAGHTHERTHPDVTIGDLLTRLSQALPDREALVYGDGPRYT